MGHHHAAASSTRQLSRSQRFLLVSSPLPCLRGAAVPRDRSCASFQQQPVQARAHLVYPGLARLHVHKLGSLSEFQIDHTAHTLYLATKARSRHWLGTTKGDAAVCTIAQQPTHASGCALPPLPHGQCTHHTTTTSLRAARPRSRPSGRPCTRAQAPLHSRAVGAQSRLQS